MTAIETHFDTIVATLATKTDLNELELKLTGVIHREHTACTWKMVTWMSAFIGMAFSGIVVVARHAPA